jgi:hypothetical protein
MVLIIKKYLPRKILSKELKFKKIIKNIDFKKNKNKKS